MRLKRRLISIGLAALMLVSLCAVCASTSVTAQMPAPGLHSGTTVCSRGAGRLDVFTTGIGYNLRHNWWDGTWHYWESLGAPQGGLTSTPTAVSWGAGRIDVFATVGDYYGGFLWHKWFDKGWHGWYNLGLLY